MGIKNKQLKASFTIEASLVIPIIMFLIVITIYMGFYLHDISIIKACAYSAGLDASFGKKGLHESAVEKINDARLFMASGTSVWTCIHHLP